MDFIKKIFLKKDYSYGILPIVKSGNGLEFLFIQSENGIWGFPKGHKEGNETDLETAKRELFEETGISEFEIIDQIFFEASYESKSKKYGHSWKVVKIFPAYIKKAEIKIDFDEIYGYKYLSLEEAKNINLYPSYQKVFKDISNWVNKIENP